jgi:multiple sugar transport system substrate-binding protein
MSEFPRRPPLRGAALLAVLGLTVTTACGEPPADTGEEDVEGEAAGLADDPDFVWAVTGADRQIHEDVAQLWNEQNPDSQVEVFFLAPTADEQRQAMFQDLQAQAGQFDVLGLDVIWTGEFADFGYIESMEDLRSEVEDVSLDGPLESAAWQEELYALPYSSNAAFLYYRTDLVDEPPATWEELMEVGLEVAEEEGISPYVGQGDQYEGFVVNYLELFWSAGGELFDPAQTTSEFLEGDAAETALDFMARAYDNGFYAEGFDSMVEDDARALFQGGEAVFMRNWPYAVPLMEGEDEEEETEVAGLFDIAPLPTFDGTGTTSALGGLNNAVSSLSENPEAAREFVLWAATSPDAQDVLAGHNLPPTMAATYDEYADDPSFELLGQVLQDARPRPPVPGYNSLSLAIQDQLHPAYLGQEDHGDALDAVDGSATEALEQE